MRITNRQFLWVILFALAITARAQEQQTNKPVPGDSPLEAVKITTNLVVLRVAVSDQLGRATMNLKQDAFKIFEDGIEQEALYRVLRAGGQLLIFEHMRSRNQGLGWVLDLMTLFIRRGGTEMNRDTLGVAVTAGFRVTRVDSVFLDIILSIHGVKPEVTKGSS